jgi:hypothetical protein
MASTTYGGLYPNFYKLYSSAKSPGPNSFSLGGRFVLNITNNLSFDLTAMWPMGASSRYMGKTFLGGFTISSFKSSGGGSSK